MKAGALWTDMSVPPAPKRRRLPQSFFLADELARARRERAAVKIERFWRWRRDLRNHTDPLSMAELCPRLTLRLVEDAGAVHNYDALTLTDYFLRSGRFLSPLTRRELTEVELLRLQKKCPVMELRALLHSTYLARRAIEAVDYSLEITRMTARDDVGEMLQVILSEAEKTPFDPNWGILHALLENYEEGLSIFAEQHVEDFSVICQVHADIAKRRGTYCPEPLIENICEVHQIIRDKQRRERLHNSARPSMAFARLMWSITGWVNRW